MAKIDRDPHDQDRARAAGSARLSAARLGAFSTLAFPINACQVPLGVYMPTIYAQYYGIGLTQLGLVMLVEKLWGALADPLVGALSDRTRSRFGRRRPWMVAGTLLFACASIVLFFPPKPFPLLLLGGALFVFYLGLSMIQIPYLAWSGELSADYHERTRIVTYQAVVMASSLLAVLILPAWVDQVRPSDGAFKLAGMGGVILVSLLPSLILTLRAAPESDLPSNLPPRQSIGSAFQVVLGDGLLMRILLSDFAMTVGQLVRGALFLFFISAYMGLARWASTLFLIQFVFGLGAAPIWNAVARRIGKHRSAIVAEIAQVAINFALLLLVPGQIGLLIAAVVLQGLTQGSGNQMLRAIIADVADKHRLETGHDRTALFFSIFSVSMKGAMAVAVGIALPLVAWFGFNPAAAHNSPVALRGLLLVFSLGPAVAHLLAAASLWNFPLDEAAHADVRRALAAAASLDGA